MNALQTLALAWALAAAAPSTSQGTGGGPVQGERARPALQPGSVPAQASERARELWGALVEASVGAPRDPVRAFDIDFDGRVYPSDRASNDVSARYQYLEPGWVRMRLRSGRERMRGPQGDFLIEKGKSYPLKGREYQEDKRELDESVAVARTFVGLTDPRRVRLASLATLAGPPAGLPESVRALAGRLEWIVVTSPDFRGPAEDPAAPLDRVEIGLDAGTHLAALAVLTTPGDARSALLVALDDYLPLDGYRVPGHLTSWRIDPEKRPAVFADRPALELWLKEGSLVPQLAEQAFVPDR